MGVPTKRILGSDGKESMCNVGDPSLIPWLRKIPGGEQATHSSILVWRILINRGAW